MSSEFFLTLPFCQYYTPFDTLLVSLLYTNLVKLKRNSSLLHFPFISSNRRRSYPTKKKSFSKFSTFFYNLLMYPNVLSNLNTKTPRLSKTTKNFSTLKKIFMKFHLHFKQPTWKKIYLWLPIHFLPILSKFIWHTEHIALNQKLIQNLKLDFFILSALHHFPSSMLI